MEKQPLGSIVWHDLTAQDAAGLSSFYKQVAGWQPEPLSMGDYDDYIIKKPGSEEVVAGICHAQGPNAYIPPQWLLYITVENLDQSLEECVRLGGEVIGPKRTMGPEQHYCLIRDPAGAYVMLCG